MHCSVCPSQACTCVRSLVASQQQFTAWPVVRCLFFARFALPVLRSPGRSQHGSDWVLADDRLRSGSPSDLIVFKRSHHKSIEAESPLRA
jgi:hypothetical protein